MPMKHWIALGLMAATTAMAGPNEDFLKAASLDLPHELARLQAKGVDVNARNERGETALHVALREESDHAALWLAEQRDVDVNARNAVGESPLMLAAIKGYVPVMKALLARGAPANAQAAREWAPLHYAASSPSLEAISLLLAQGAQVNALSPNGTTPLMMAARYGAFDASEVLLKAGADPRLQNDLKLSAADFANAVDRPRLAERFKQVTQ